MLRVGLTGGIGSGKSTVATTLAQLGAVVIDADKLARDVVAPGTPALAQIVEVFGEQILAPDGSLNRPALGQIVFSDKALLRRLEAITHAAIKERTLKLFAQAPPEAIVVHDVPLLTELGMSADYHLVVCVGASEEIRLERLLQRRGMTPEDARARIAAQANDAQRRAAADVWLDNECTPEALETSVREVWARRLVPFADNITHGIRSALTSPVLSPPDPTWPEQGARLIGRLQRALGERAEAIDHIGSTAVPQLIAKDVIDLQVGVRSLEMADDPAFVQALTGAGFPLVAHIDRDNGKHGQEWPKRFYGSYDPARVTHVHVRETHSPGWEWALGFRNLLRENEKLRREYAAMKSETAANLASSSDYADAKEPWFDRVSPQVEAFLRGDHSPG